MDALKRKTNVKWTLKILKIVANITKLFRIARNIDFNNILVDSFCDYQLLETTALNKPLMVP